MPLPRTANPSIYEHEGANSSRGGTEWRADGSGSLLVMPQTAKECGVEKGARAQPGPVTTSSSATRASLVNSPINAHENSLMRPPPRAAKHQLEEKSLRRLIDKASMAGVGEKHCTRGASSQRERERFSVARRRASASDATAATTPAASSSRGSSLDRRASASNATTSTPASSSRAGFFGSFDDSRYWDYASRFTQRQDIGNKCRECKRPFLVLNEEIVVRR